MICCDYVTKRLYIYVYSIEFIEYNKIVGSEKNHEMYNYWVGINKYDI